MHGRMDYFGMLSHALADEPASPYRIHLKLRPLELLLDALRNKVSPKVNVE
jgi:hypothetical protein